MADLEGLPRKTLLLGGDETFRREMDRLRQQLGDALGRNRFTEFKQIDLSRVAVGSPRGTSAKPQIIKSPQLQTIISLTQQQNRLLERTPVAIAG